MTWPKAVESRDGAHNALESEVVRSDVTSKGLCTLEEESMCSHTTETFEPWSNKLNPSPINYASREMGPSVVLELTEAETDQIMRTIVWRWVLVARVMKKILHHSTQLIEVVVDFQVLKT